MKNLSRSLVDFFVIGAARCGTTSLYRSFEKHPQVFVPNPKEPRFFKSAWSKGWDWYKDLYAGKGSGQIAGDFSPDYSISRGETLVPERIKRYFPDARIVYLVRNPVEAAISNWQMLAEIRDEGLTFAQALDDPAWSVSVLERVRFFKQISLYRQFFDDDMIRALPLELLRRQPESLDDLCAFLGIEPLGARLPWANRTNLKPLRPEKPVVAERDRQEFVSRVSDDAESMLTYMGLPPDFWDLSSGWG